MQRSASVQMSIAVSINRYDCPRMLRPCCPLCFQLVTCLLIKTYLPITWRPVARYTLISATQLEILTSRTLEHQCNRIQDFRACLSWRTVIAICELKGTAMPQPHTLTPSMRRASRVFDCPYSPSRMRQWHTSPKACSRIRISLRMSNGTPG